MRDVFGDRPLEVALADRDDPIEALQHRCGLLNRALDTVIPTALNADDNLNHDQHDDRDFDPLASRLDSRAVAIVQHRDNELRLKRGDSRATYSRSTTRRTTRFL